MKKKISKYRKLQYIIALILVSLLLQACNNQKETPASETTEESKVIIETAAKSSAEPLPTETDSSTEAPETTNAPSTAAPASDSNEFVGTLEYGGYIGDSPIRMTLRSEADNTRIEGEYWYTKYNVPIPISGWQEEANIRLLNHPTGTDELERFILLLTDEWTQKGLWQKGETNAPCYLELLTPGEDSVSKPDPSTSLSAFAGTWSGLHSNSFTYTILDFVPLYNNLIYFDLNAANGAYSGGIDGIAEFDGTKIVFTEYGVTFAFTMDANQQIKLDCNDYQYSCGNGVSYEAEYQKGTQNIQTQTTLAFLTAEENAKLQELTGAHYQDLLQVGQWGDEESFELNGQPARMIRIGVRGYMRAAALVIQESSGFMGVLIDTYDEAAGEAKMLYFTNNDEFLTPPQPMLEWLGELEYELVR